ncbi:MAG: NUDIX domain-containing protein [Candidatus Melainabacteria bacterium]|jgi:ADP-ribose pyrophosphatase YjhB (NUDIX family)|nr:NUDIX domain-containing protein [Candidatus Melainabacteria bacterium]MBX9674649.1 NUDIX domain-containing protein [Candidatus Obscuribacterales bacterium]
MSDYKFCPLCGTTLGVIVEEGVSLPHCHGCKKFTHYDNPKGVSVLIVPRDGGIVMVKRGVAPQIGKWALPAGYINKGEGPRQAGVREGNEEVGLDLEIVRALDEMPVPGANLFMVFYETRVVGGVLKAGSDALEVGVFDLSNLPSSEEIAFSLHEKKAREWLTLQQALASHR